MNTSMLIPNDRLRPAIIAFVEGSCLADCTTTANDYGDQIVVTTSWPVAAFSTGEQASWGVLRSLTSGELRALCIKVDPDTIGALIGCLGMLRESVTAS